MTIPGTGSEDQLFLRHQDILRDPGRSVVIITEHSWDIPSVRAIRANSRAQIRVVSSSPAASWELEKLGIPFQGIDGYCDHPAVVNLGMENFQTVRLLCDLIDDELEARIPLVRESGFRVARDNFLYFKILYDGLSIRREILGELLDRVDPDLLLSMEGIPGGRAPGNPVMPFSPWEHCYTTVLSSPGWPYLKDVVKVLPPARKAGKESRIRISDGIRAMLLRNSFLFNVAFTKKRYGTRSALRVLSDAVRNYARGGERLLFTGYAYNWHSLIPELYRRGFQLAHLRLPERVGTSDTGKVEIDESLVRPCCQLKGIDVSSALVRKANTILSKSIREAELHSAHISRVLDSRNPRAVLCGPRSRFLDHLPNRIAGHRGIPILSWQHGAQGINRAPIMLYAEAMGSDVHLCFGDGVREEFAEEARDRFSCDLRAVGSYELEELTRAPLPAKPEFSVLYATTNYYKGDFYISAPSVFLDTELWETQRALLDMLGRSGRKTALKLHPGSRDENLREYLETREYRNITVFREERTFPDLLRCCDVVVLDFPSTVLLQSIAAGKPVFVLTKHLALTRKAATLLARRAGCAEDLTTFLSLLEGYLRGDRPEPPGDLRDTGFLTEYGLHRLDGNVAGRAVEVLREAVGRRSPPAG